MREQLLTMLEDEALAGEWHSFLTLLLYELDDDSATPPVFLSAAMIGELADMSAEDDGAED